MPTMTERLKSVETLVKALAALLALMPGIAVLTGLIDIPPTLVQLVKSLSFFVSIVVLIGILLVSQRIRRMTGTAVAILALGAVVVGAAGAVGYWSFAGRHIVLVESADGEGEAQTERYLVPMRPSAEIQRLVAPYSGDYAEALLTSNQRARLRQLMDQDSGGTAALMIVLLVLAQTLLVAGVAAGAWKLAMSDEDDQTGKSGAASPPPYSAPASG